MTNQPFAQFFFQSCRKIGIIPAIAYKAKSLFYPFVNKLGMKVKGSEFPLFVKNIKYPVYCRYGTSDSFVFDQIFVNEEYAGLGNIENVDWIIDCGANVGYSAVYLLNKYPQAKIIAVEPDPENFELCAQNLAPYGDRVHMINSAIWSSTVDLVIDRPLQDNGEWAVQVRPCEPGETPALNAIDIKSLLDNFDLKTVDILKVDIETAELEVFAHNYQEWLKKVKNIAIELHGKDCEEVFFKAISSIQHNSWSAGELTFCQIDQQQLVSVA
ncbi:FkbM family methyltransferase [Fortiea contorta]|uniref:FkbM family methyltransferase n=1 Tax=Fortiea contorta TaxID=1892405 RepID=UPI00034D5459|nr:FkbM family methyltransferase [Fortiea contorta]